VSPHELVQRRVEVELGIGSSPETIAAAVIGDLLAAKWAIAHIEDSRWYTGSPTGTGAMPPTIRRLYYVRAGGLGLPEPKPSGVPGE
jgi:hypothetical protein